MLLYECGEILTRGSIAVTRACECHAIVNDSSVNISPFSYNNVFIIHLDHSNIMDDILTSEIAVVISFKLVSCLPNAYM